MPGTAKGARKGRKTNAAKKAFKVWYEDQKQAGTLLPDEVFVPVYDRKKQGENYKLYISNHGRCVSFGQDTSKPVFYDVDDYTERDGYLEFNPLGNENVHTVVWWSYMWAYITAGYRPMPMMELVQKGSHGKKRIKDKFASKEEFKNSCRTRRGKYEVHHQNKEKHDNRLSNLICLTPKTHKWVEETKDFSDQLDSGKKVIKTSKGTYRDVFS